MEKWAKCQILRLACKWFMLVGKPHKELGCNQQKRVFGYVYDHIEGLKIMMYLCIKISHRRRGVGL
jgi:hypothetical protein